MVQGILEGLVLLKRPGQGGRGTSMKKNTVAFQAVNFSFPSTIATQNKLDYTSENASIQDPGEIIDIYDKETRPL